MGKRAKKTKAAAPAKRARKRNAPSLEDVRAKARQALRDAEQLAERAQKRAKGTIAKLQGEVAGLKRRLRKRGNPDRPPSRWWDECIRHVETRDGRKVHDVRAVCGAAWWRLPEATREQIVRQLERSPNPKRRALAHGLARLERRKHRKANPKELVSLTYREQKRGDARPFDYEHDFSGELPELVEKAGRLRLVGGSYRVRGGWIHG